VLFVARLLPRRLRPRVAREEPRDVSPKLARLRWVQQGALHACLLYILIVVMPGLACVTFRAWSGA
jgi:hypothetical protein